MQKKHRRKCSRRQKVTQSLKIHSHRRIQSRFILIYWYKEIENLLGFYIFNMLVYYYFVYKFNIFPNLITDESSENGLQWIRCSQAAKYESAGIFDSFWRSGSLSSMIAIKGANIYFIIYPLFNDNYTMKQLKYHYFDSNILKIEIHQRVYRKTCAVLSGPQVAFVFHFNPYLQCM